MFFVFLGGESEAKPHHNACHYYDYVNAIVLKTTPAARTAMNQGLLKASSAMDAWHMSPLLLNFLSCLHEHLPSSIMSFAS